MCMYGTTGCYWDISITSYEGGCYSSLIIKKYVTNILSSYERRINAARLRGQWINMTTAAKNTVLQEWDVNMRDTTSRLMTHYHHRPRGSFSQIRPPSLTGDCGACIVLPILLKSTIPVYSNTGECTCVCYDYSYFLPIFRRSSDDISRYKAIGTYYVGTGVEKSKSPTFHWSHCVGRDDIHHMKELQEILDILFENDYHGDVPKEFVIE